ncbi:MAG: hypothetical protein ACR2MW_07540 [Chthoniobacterales bacterium]
MNYLEAFQAEQLLRLLDSTDGLELPVCIEHRDKPDFILSTRARTIGLETSSFTDEEVMRADHLHFTRYPNAYITTTGLRDGPVRRSSEEIAATMLEWDSPWENVIDRAEHVARKIFESIRIKQQKFHSTTFQKFEENWLLLTDHRNPFSDVITDDILARHLLAALQRGDAIGTEFERVYIFYGPRCFRIQKGQLARKIDQKEA